MSRRRGRTCSGTRCLRPPRSSAAAADPSRAVVDELAGLARSGRRRTARTASRPRRARRSAAAAGVNVGFANACEPPWVRIESWVAIPPAYRKLRHELKSPGADLALDQALVVAVVGAAVAVTDHAVRGSRPRPGCRRRCPASRPGPTSPGRSRAACPRACRSTLAVLEVVEAESTVFRSLVAAERCSASPRRSSTACAAGSRSASRRRSGVPTRSRSAAAPGSALHPDSRRGSRRRPAPRRAWRP